MSSFTFSSAIVWRICSSKKESVTVKSASISLTLEREHQSLSRHKTINHLLEESAGVKTPNILSPDRAESVIVNTSPNIQSPDKEE